MFYTFKDFGLALGPYSGDASQGVGTFTYSPPEFFTANGVQILLPKECLKIKYNNIDAKYFCVLNAYLIDFVCIQFLDDTRDLFACGVTLLWFMGYTFWKPDLFQLLQRGSADSNKQLVRDRYCFTHINLNTTWKMLI